MVVLEFSHLLDESVTAAVKDTELHSVVVPMFNEESVAEQFVARATATLTKLTEYELIVVDDGSEDRTYEILKRLADHDSHLKLVRLARNFGHQTAISAGMALAAGDTVTVIDADLQDPPELIPDMVERWRAGADVVFAVRETRKGETIFKRASASLFYRFIRSFTKMDIPLDAGDFRLMSRRAADALIGMPEHNRFVRGLVAWIGLRRDHVHYHRDPRYAGVTKYSLPKMLRFAADGVLSFSNRPLQLAVWLGFLSSAVSAMLGLYFIVLRLTTNQIVEGWTSLMLVVLFLGGVQLVTLGIVGEYVGRIHDEVRGRPLYLVDETANMGEDLDSHFRRTPLPPR